MQEYYDELIEINDAYEKHADIARKLGITPQNLYQTVVDGRSLSQPLAVKLAELLERHPGELLCASMAEKSKNDEVKKIWREMVAVFQADE